MAKAERERLAAEAKADAAKGGKGKRGVSGTDAPVEPPLFEFIIDAIARVTDGARMRAHRRRDASDAIDAVASDAADAIGNRDGTGADETRKRLNVRRLVTHFVTLKLFH